MNIKGIIKSFFMSKNKIQPVYIWISILMILVIVTFIMKLCGIEYISDTLLLGVLAFIVSWAGLYNINKKTDIQPEYNEEQREHSHRRNRTMIGK